MAGLWWAHGGLVAGCEVAALLAALLVWTLSTGRSTPRLNCFACSHQPPSTKACNCSAADGSRLDPDWIIQSKRARTFIIYFEPSKAGSSKLRTVRCQRFALQAPKAQRSALPLLLVRRCRFPCCSRHAHHACNTPALFIV